MVSLCPLQGQEAGDEKTTNLEIAADFDCPFETFQFRQQQMGKIAEGRQFPVQRFRSDTVFGIGAARDNFTAQRIDRARHQVQCQWQSHEWFGDG